MKRRELTTLLTVVSTAWPLVARAQNSARTARIGVLMGIGENDPKRDLAQRPWKMASANSVG
jgi:hypothetical protein